MYIDADEINEPLNKLYDLATRITGQPCSPMHLFVNGGRLEISHIVGELLMLARAFSTADWDDDCGDVYNK